MPEQLRPCLPCSTVCRTPRWRSWLPAAMPVCPCTRQRVQQAAAQGRQVQQLAVLESLRTYLWGRARRLAPCSASTPVSAYWVLCSSCGSSACIIPPKLAAAHGAIGATAGFGAIRHAPSGRRPETTPRVYNCAAGERLPEREEAAAGGDHAGAAQLQRTSTLTDYERSETAREFQLYVCEVLQQL